MRDVALAKGCQARARVIVSTLANVLRAGNTKTTLTAPRCHKAVVIPFAGHALKTSRIWSIHAIASGSVHARIACYLEMKKVRGVLKVTVGHVGVALVSGTHHVIVNTLVIVTTVEKTEKMTKQTYFRGNNLSPSTSRMKGVDFPLAGCAMAQQKSVSEEAAGGSVNAVYAAMHATKSCKTKKRERRIDKATPIHMHGQFFILRETFVMLP